MQPQAFRRRMAAAGGLLVLTAGGLVLAGCGDDSTATTAAAGATTGTAEIVETSQLTVFVGGTRVVGLKQSPSTGYTWKATGGSAIDEGLVELTDTDYDEPGAEGITDADGTEYLNFVGQDGVAVFVYEGKKAGEGELTYDLLAPGTEEVTETRTVAVTVLPAVTDGAQSNATTFNGTVGNPVQVRLDEFPANGYTWRAAGGTALDDGLVRFEEESAGPPDADPSGDPPYGTPNTRLFQYEGLKAGTGTLDYELVNPGNDQVVDTHTVTVTLTD